MQPQRRTMSAPATSVTHKSTLENCSCLSVASKRVWELTVAFVCDELAVLKTWTKRKKHRTQPLTYFVRQLKRETSPIATDFDTFELDEVVRMYDSINLNGGFHIKGWYKPSLDEEGAANDLKKLHFCYF